jgi:hypothetical protein
MDTATIMAYKRRYVGQRILVNGRMLSCRYCSSHLGVYDAVLYTALDTAKKQEVELIALVLRCTGSDASGKQCGYTSVLPLTESLQLSLQCRPLIPEQADEIRNWLYDFDWWQRVGLREMPEEGERATDFGENATADWSLKMHQRKMHHQ